MTFAEARAIFTREQIKLLQRKAREAYPGSRENQRRWMRAKIVCTSAPKVKISSCAANDQYFARQSGIKRGTKFVVNK